MSEINMPRGFPYVYVVHHHLDDPNRFRFINIGFRDIRQFFDAVFVELEPILKLQIDRIGAVIIATSFYAMFTVNRTRREPFVHCESARPVYSFDRHNLTEMYSDNVVKPILNVCNDFLSHANSVEVYDIDRFVIQIESIQSLENYIEPKFLH